jgi:hypothetical protein
MPPSAHWQQRIDDVLRVELGGVVDRTDAPWLYSSYSTRPTGAPVPPAGVGAVDAIEQIGLLDPTQADQWRARMAEAARPRPAIEVSPALRARVHDLLGEAVREARAARALGDARPARLSALLDALRRLGLLDDADMRWWSDILYAGEPLPFEPRLERLERSIAGPPERRRGLRILSLDLFDRGVFVRLQIARNGRAEDGLVHPLGDELEPDAPLASQFAVVRLGDDVGTAYRVLGGGGGSGGTARRSDGPFVWHWLMAFAPHVPEGARALVVDVGELQFEVVL